MTELLRKYILEERDDHNDNEEEDDPNKTVVAKAVAMCVLFCASFIIGILPIKLSKWFNWDSDPKNNKMVQLLLCFGGGVLLCTTFLHLLPEVAEHVNELEEEGRLPAFKMHFAEFLMCIGFFTMYFVEECVHTYLHRREKNKEMNVLRKSLSIRRGEMERISNESKSVSTTELVKDAEEGRNRFHDHSHMHDHEHNGHSHLIIEDTVVKSIRGLLVVLALSVHELFEGLAVGLESSASTVWYMFGAVSAHKLVIAFCIGVELVTTNTKVLLNVIYVLTFAIVSPMGIGIGIAISEDAESSTDLVSVILQGLASGTLLYVVFFEILQKDRKGGLMQYTAILLGFFIMLIITVFSKYLFYYHCLYYDKLISTFYFFFTNIYIFNS